MENFWNVWVFSLQLAVAYLPLWLPSSRYLYLFSSLFPYQPNWLTQMTLPDVSAQGFFLLGRFVYEKAKMTTEIIF